MKIPSLLSVLLSAWMGIRHYQDVVGVVQMYGDSISFVQFFKDMSDAIDFVRISQQSCH